MRAADSPSRRNTLDEAPGALLTTPEAARFLRMSPRWLQGQTAAGVIQALRLCRPGAQKGAVRYRRSDLEAYIASLTAQPVRRSGP